MLIVGRREATGATLAAAFGEAVAYARADVRIESDVRAVIDHAAQRFGRVDCLVNNAGMLPPVARSSLESSAKRWG